MIFIISYKRAIAPDRKRQTVGIKPLYYAAMPDRLLFGSELKALWAASGWTPTRVRLQVSCATAISRSRDHLSRSRKAAARPRPDRAQWRIADVDLLLGLAQRHGTIMADLVAITDAPYKAPEMVEREICSARHALSAGRRARIPALFPCPEQIHAGR
jgi:asparagine synthetase B (glutamine-hydrolysing)